MAAAIRLVISGRVQGVGFRAYLAREAMRRGVAGWVRNRRDGTVEALLIGEPALLAEMEQAVRRGPRLSAVSSVDRHSAADDGSVGFHELPTA